MKLSHVVLSTIVSLAVFGCSEQTSPLMPAADIAHPSRAKAPVVTTKDGAFDVSQEVYIPSLKASYVVEGTISYALTLIENRFDLDTHIDVRITGKDAADEGYLVNAKRAFGGWIDDGDGKNVVGIYDITNSKILAGVVVKYSIGSDVTLEDIDLTTARSMDTLADQVAW